MQGLTIVKVGGAIVDNPTQMATLLGEFSRKEGLKILVHGGGRRATEMASQLGMPTRMVDGRRVTDEATLELVTMVYGGMNKNIVARLLPLGVRAVGLTGADMGIVRAVKRPRGEVDYGYVGDVEEVDGERLSWLLREGVTPVVAPLTVDADGQLLNTNADTVASAVAVTMAKEYEVELVYVMEKAGVLADEKNPHSLIRRITRGIYEELKTRGMVTGGMVPKVENALEAVDAGVKEVRITSYEDLSGGTIVEAGA